MRLNPSTAEEVLNDADAPGAGQNKGAVDGENTNELAALIQNSTLLRSYEQMMGEFEADNERKQKQIGQLERDQ